MKEIEYMLDLLEKRKASCFCDKRELIRIKRSIEILNNLKEVFIEAERIRKQVK